MGDHHDHQMHATGRRPPPPQYGNTSAKKHGWFGTKTYRVWCHMKERCSYQRHKSWANYGGRGIKVCERWQSFENFLADMGPVPERMTLERKKTDGNYEPENCRWATCKEQANNRRSNKILTAFGESKTAIQWSNDSRCMAPYTAVLKRIEYGWSDSDVICRPSRIMRNSRPLDHRVAS